jgi:hypothetical protein
MRQAGAAVLPIVTLVGGAGVLGVLVSVLGGNEYVGWTPEYLAWAGLVSVGVVLYGGVFARTSVHLHKQSLEALVVPGIAYMVLGVMVYAIADFAPPFVPLPTISWVPRVLNMVVLVCAAPAVLTLWLVRSRLLRLDLNPFGMLDSLLVIRADIRRSLIALSLIVSSAMVNVVVLRHAYVTHGLEPRYFPPPLVLAYGAVLTGIVALIYVPAYLAWRDRALALIDETYPAPYDARPTEEWSTGRTRLTTLLSPNDTIGRSVGTALSILTPLATALLAYLTAR